MVAKRPDGSLRPVLMDFGLAREMGAQQGLTESGAIMGTPAYMPPEQARGDTRRLDRRSDVYSLGATLYDVLTGNPPFDDQTVVNILLKVMNDAPLPLRSHVPTLPAQVELIVSKCLNKEPAQRYATAKDLADDLQRYLTSQRVVARRLSYTYRLAYWARRNKTLAVVAAALVISSGAFVTSAVRGRLATIRQQQKAKAQAELAQRLGQSVKDVEWVARTSYLLPLHDVKNEQQLVRARMAELKAELAQERDIGERLGAYVQGRGHLALHDYVQARTQLLLAEKLGHRDPELDYALGRAYGALYTQALEDARRSGDKSFFDARKKELDVELLAPTLAYLNKSRGAAGISVSYVQGLVAFYQQQYEPALRFAEQAHKEAPWLYEAVQLGGQVRLAQALDQRDRGEHTAAEQSFTDAAARLSKAAEIGRSDHQVYEALAETYIRWEELDYFQAKDPAAKVKEALLAADRALAASPQESHGHTKKSYAYLFLGNYLQRHGKPADALKVREQQLEEGKLAVAQHADDAYAHETLGSTYMRMSEAYVADGRPIQDYLKGAYVSFESAAKINPRFPWAYNGHAIAMLAEAQDISQKNTNPLEKIYKAIELSKKAYQIDPQYIYSYNTITLATVRAAAWMMEHGIDPAQMMQEGESAAQKALQINPNYISVFGNLGDLHMIVSIYGILEQRIVEKVTEKAVFEHARMLAAQPKNASLHMYLSYDYYTLAMQQISSRKDPSATLQKGFEYAASCHAAQAGHPLCQYGESLLLSARAQWLAQQSQPFLPDLQQAYKLIGQALAKLQDDADGLLAGADIAYQLAQAQLRSGGRPVRIIQEGLKAADRALVGTVGWPRAQALRGALLLLTAKTAAKKPAQLAAAQQAQQALTESFAGNPLLRRRFGGLLEEAAQLLKDQ